MMEGKEGGRRREEGRKKKGNKNGKVVNRESQAVMELHFSHLIKL